jgi:hypothetical protein
VGEHAGILLSSADILGMVQDFNFKVFYQKMVANPMFWVWDETILQFR